jgi:fumarate hydratase class II
VDTTATTRPLDPALATRIATAADAVAAGEHDDQFPIDAFQTGWDHP